MFSGHQRRVVRPSSSTPLAGGTQWALQMVASSACELEAQMGGGRAAEVVVDRLRQVRVLEAEIEVSAFVRRSALDAAPQAAAAVDRMVALARRHLSAIDALLAAPEREVPETPPVASTALAPPGVLEAMASSASQAVIAYSSLYAISRLMYRPDVCDLASTHANAWNEALYELNDVLPGVLAADLRQQGLACQCVCPACGIGACGCVWNSIQTMRGVSGRSGLAPEEGIELLVPPRAGSQLAAAGLQQGDRILTVDGEVVHAIPDLQRALRQHDIGDPAAVRVLRAGESVELQVARVSDLP